MDLPEDIHTLILKRLPVKSLLRFRCVCKSWLHLITSPRFIQQHLDFSNRCLRSRRARIILSRYCDTLLSIGPEEPSAPPPPLPPNNNNKITGFEEAVELDFGLVQNLPYYVKGHCDGLLCLVINDGGDGSIVIWNPSIGESKRLPLPHNFRSTREVFGIGYDSSIGDYKVVRAPSSYCRMKCPGYKPRVQVLTLRSNSWRTIPEKDTPPYFIEHFFQATNVNGGLYWLVAHHDDVFRCEILRFDLAVEKFKVVPPPPPDESGRTNISWLGPLEGSLCVIHTQRLNHVDVWATKDDETWTKLITIPRIPGPEASVRYFDYVPLCFTKSGSVLISVKGEGFVTYHPRENKVRKLAVHGVENWFQETACAETLVSPRSGDEPAAARQHHRGSAQMTSRSVWQLLLNYFSCSSGGSKHP